MLFLAAAALPIAQPAQGVAADAAANRPTTTASPRSRRQRSSRST